MEEAATQDATQSVKDPRRHDFDSMLSEEDACDVLCILHPTSLAAYRAVQLVADLTPQHILQNESLSHKSKDGNGSIIEGSTQSERASPRGSMLDNLGLDSKSQAASESEGRTMDIALRLSSKLKDPCLGFTFGRGQTGSDVIIVQDENRTISHRHFRIYLNTSGITMLESTSKQGTIVDSVLLNGNTEDSNAEKTRIISGGSKIRVNSGANLDMRFIVSIPSRDGVEDRWHDKKQNYIEYISQYERQRAVRAENPHEGAATAILLPTNPLGPNVRKDSTINIDCSRNVMAGAGSKGNQYGMEWNGGEDYTVVGFLGQGAFASVVKLATKREGRLLAGKQIEKRKFVKNGVVDRKIKNEMHIMKDLEHPHIVKFIKHEETPRLLILIMEFVPSGDLSAFISTGYALPEFSCQRIAWQICSALEYLHKRNITHRDIKPENILIASREPLNVKLSDFGLSKQITSDDANLQTFCGTILYCAPEVYPGYDGYKSGKAVKRRRQSDRPPKTRPYQQSVDIWAFAAVLYHLLCACPPYEGTAIDKGAAMLDTVMNNDVDFSKLQSAGVSDDGIDFVSRMLKHDPLARATEVECLQHPWIVRTADSKPNYLRMEGTASLGVIEEDQVDPSRLSQLSLTENPRAVEIADSIMEYDTDVDELTDTRRSKRFRPNKDANRGIQGEDIAYPSLPGVQVGAIRSPSNHPQTINRLFGEIGASALRNPEFLSYDARAALDVRYRGSRDGWKERHITSDGLANQASLYSQNSAPSLLGAEAMVGQLNMASLESAASTVSSPDSIASIAKTAPLPASAVVSTKRTSQVFPSADESTPKRAKPNRPDAPSQRSQPGGSSTDYGLYGSQKPSTHDQALQEPTAQATAAKTSIADDRGERKEHSKSSKASARTSGLPAISSAQPPQDSTYVNDHVNDKSVSASVPHEAADEASYTASSRCLGVLTSLPGSVCNIMMKLEDRFTFFGRDPASHVRYEDKMDTRVPKNALDVIWWRPGIEAMLADGMDWRDVEGLIAIVHTRTSLYIRVNGVRLTRGKNRWHFGRLHTGDVITIFGPEEGEVAEGKEREFLKFRCEFFAGPSARPREEPFIVEKEKKEKEKRPVSKGSEMESKPTAISDTDVPGM